MNFWLKSIDTAIVLNILFRMHLIQQEWFKNIGIQIYQSENKYFWKVHGNWQVLLIVNIEVTPGIFTSLLTILRSLLSEQIYFTVFFAIVQ